MQVAEASVVVPLSPEETWDLLFGNPQQEVVELFADIVAVEDYQIRADGTPRYRMIRKAGPFTMSFISDYSVFERPHRTVSRALDSPIGDTTSGRCMSAVISAPVSRTWWRPVARPAPWARTPAVAAGRRRCDCSPSREPHRGSRRRSGHDRCSR